MTRLVFLDTETTSLRPDRRVWEVGLIVRTPETPPPWADPETRDEEHRWFIHADDLDLGNADPFSLSIGRFYDRHPDYAGPADEGALPEEYVLRKVEELTRGAHLVGAVPNFDAEVLGARMRANGILPSWHHHLIDVEALAIGWLNGRRARQNEIVDGYPLENGGAPAPGLVRWNEPVTGLPWRSDELSVLVGVETDESARHTALGDAKWARDIYDAVMGGGS
jgi:hypothetical protein